MLFSADVRLQLSAVNQSRAWSITLGLVLLAIGALVPERCFAAGLNVAVRLDFVGQRKSGTCWGDTEGNLGLQAPSVSWGVHRAWET